MPKIEATNAPKFKYVVYLKDAHNKTGLTYYRVSKATGVNIDTVKKYATEDAIEVERLNVGIAALADFYGVPFHEAVRVVKEN